jgi:NAD(P)-dependent dehydrogenase (short-subunit alcohol dehydrogenase family)
MDLEGQVAIVTGAGRGIGRAIALELARLGADIAVAEMNQASADETAASVEQAGRRAIATRVDVTRAEDRALMVAQALSAFGRLDILVNNAGIYRWAAPIDITEQQWDEVLDVNSKAVLFCSQAVLPSMVAAGRGAIVSVASMAGKVPSANALVYAVSKSAVISLTRSLAIAYAGNGIRVNCVCPGFVDTEMWAQIDREIGQGLLGKQPRELWNERVATIPLGRGETPEDVANVVGFLASSKSSYMTGQAVNVTGGLIMY